MGAGKSTVGRELAHRLGRPFADSDAVAERRAGCSVRALWERDGEAAFRALEESVVRELLERDDAPVIALGGGALTSEATRHLLRERALCAWLDAPVATCWQRMDGAPGARPLAGDREEFEQLHGRREPTQVRVCLPMRADLEKRLRKELVHFGIVAGDPRP